MKMGICRGCGESLPIWESLSEEEQDLLSSSGEEQTSIDRGYCELCFPTVSIPPKRNGE